jgi:biopolymer transport protein ExbD
MDSINVIPFIDIMLVLLAIVLATATFIAEGRLDIALPEAEQRPGEAPAAPVEIAIDAGGALYFDAVPIDLDDLEARLDSLDTATAVALRVDKTAEFGAFVSVIDLLRARGLERLNITTRTPRP